MMDVSGGDDDDLRLSEFYKLVWSSSPPPSLMTHNLATGIIRQHLSQVNYFQASTTARMETRVTSPGTIRTTLVFR